MRDGFSFPVEEILFVHRLARAYPSASEESQIQKYLVQKPENYSHPFYDKKGFGSTFDIDFGFISQNIFRNSLFGDLFSMASHNSSPPS